MKALKDSSTNDLFTARCIIIVQQKDPRACLPINLGLHVGHATRIQLCQIVWLSIHADTSPQDFKALGCQTVIYPSPSRFSDHSITRLGSCHSGSIRHISADPRQTTEALRPPLVTSVDNPLPNHRRRSLSAAPNPRPAINYCDFWALPINRQIMPHDWQRCCSPSGESNHSTEV